MNWALGHGPAACAQACGSPRLLFLWFLFVSLRFAPVFLFSPLIVLCFARPPWATLGSHSPFHLRL